MASSKELSRPDGRSANQIRPLVASRGLLNRAHGSARWEQGSTAVLAAVFGPTKQLGNEADPLKAKIDVSFRPKTGLAGREERAAEVFIRDTVQSAVLASTMPRTQIQITVQVVHDDGSLLSCSLNAVCLALLDACIPLATVFTSATCVLPVPGDVAEGTKGLPTIIFDPTKDEEGSGPSLCASFPVSPVKGDVEGDKSRRQQVEDAMISCITRGGMKSSSFVLAVEHCRAACGKIGAFMRHSLERYHEGVDGDLSSS